MSLLTATVTLTDKVTGQTAKATASCPVKVAQHVGAICSPAGACPSSVTAWLSLGAQTFGTGTLGANKMFYSGTQPMTTWQQGHLKTDCEAQLPKNCLVIVCYQAAQIPSLPRYVASIPADQAEVWMVYDQEAENDPGGDYKTFIANSITASKAIRSAGHPNVKVVQDSAGSKYGAKGSTAQQGLWVVPPEWVDVYAIDCYQNQAAGAWPSQGLANYTEFQTWLSIYAPLGRMCAIAEYGVSACNGAAARSARIQQDCATLRATFGGGPGAASPLPMAAWLYWYSNCQADQFMTDCQHTHQFTDAATISTWKGICGGTI